MLVLIGPKGIGGWQHREIQLGLHRRTVAAARHVIFASNSWYAGIPVDAND